MSYADQVITNDFLWKAIVDAVSHFKKKRNGRWLNINCPMCVSRGETADKRRRCGIRNDANKIGIHCFNCDFKTRHSPGERMHKEMKKFLRNIGVNDDEIKKIAYKLGQIASVVSRNPEISGIILPSFMNFPEKALPEGARSLAEWADDNCLDQDFLDVANYIYLRGNDIADAIDYYWTPINTPGEISLSRRVIIPFKYHGKIVGYTARAIDNASPKYAMYSPRNYLYNADLLNDPSREIIYLVEGVLDAVAINAVGTLGAKLNDVQISWLKSFGKKIVVVPDRDVSGSRLIDIAVSEGWAVAFPALNASYASENWWEPDCKDSAEATRRYGRLYTMASIFKTMTDSRFEINVKRKMMC